METSQFRWDELDGPARPGLLVLGHRDYQLDLGLDLARQAVARLQEQGLQVAWTPRVLTNARDAAAAARELLAEQPDGVIIFAATWLEGDTVFAALRELEHLPLMLWGVPMVNVAGKPESTGSFVAVISLKGPLGRVYERLGFEVGLPDDPDTLTSLGAFARAAAANGRLKRTRLGLMGYAAMSIYAGTFDPVRLRAELGPEVPHLDTCSLVREIERVTLAEAQPWLEKLQAVQAETTPERVQLAARMTEALARLALRHQLHGLNVKCQYELSQEYGMTPCLPLALLADEGLLASCEGDMMVHVAQAMLRHLTGQVIPYADLLDLQDRRALFSACGFAPLCLRHEADPCRVCEFDHPGFSGLICSFTLKRGPVTFAQLAPTATGYRLLYGTGRGVETELRGGRFPALQVELDGTEAQLLEQVQSQHFALCYGDASRELALLARLLGVEAAAVL